MKKIVLLVLFVAIAAAIINDVGSYAKARYDLDRIATDTTGVISSQGTESRNQNANDASRYAASRGAVVYAYDQSDQGVSVWLQMPVEGTWVVGPVMSLLAGESLDKPYLIQIEKTASFR